MNILEVSFVFIKREEFMNLYKYINEKIDLDIISDFKDEIYELAIVRMLLKELSKLFYRDYTFFLNKENLDDREAIYNKGYDLHDFQDFSVTCKRFSRIVVDLLKSNYNIDAEIISSTDDKFRHVDVLIKTKNGKRYIVDPLTDLIEIQVGLKTNNFASKEYYDNTYSQSIEDISFLTEDELEEIDDKIKYTPDVVYLDEFLLYLKEKLDNIEELLKQNDRLSVELLGEKYDGRELSENERTELKLKFISKFFNNRKNLNGTVDLLMFANFIVKKIFLSQEQENIFINSFFVDKKDLDNTDLKRMLKGRENRKRGVVITYNGKNYVFSLNSRAIEYTGEEWKKIVEKNKIFIRPKYPVKLLKYLKNNGVDRNLVHNNEFLRLFSIFENRLLNSGKSIEDIKRENVLIRDGMVLTKIGKKNISYKIENGNLVIEDYKRNLKHIIFYKDEGRNISCKSEPIIKDIDIEKEKEKYTLSTTEFRDNVDDIFKELSKDVSKSEAKKFIIICGQAGSGKTGLVSKKNEELNKGAIIINQDDLREKFPISLYQELISKYDERTIYLILRSYMINLIDAIIDKAIENEYNVIFETSLSYIKPVIDYINKFKEESYDIEASIIVVHELEARLSMFKRYCDVLEKDGVCRRATKMSGNAYENFNENMKILQKQDKIDNIEAYIRNNEIGKAPIKIYSKNQNLEIDLSEVMKKGEEDSYIRFKDSFEIRYKRIKDILEENGEEDKIRELEELYEIHRKTEEMSNEER